LVFAEVRRKYEKIAIKARLETLLGYLQIGRGSRIEPAVDARTHQGFVIPEIGDPADAERGYELAAPHWAVSDRDFLLGRPTYLGLRAPHASAAVTY
jgi:hypothetical protein